MNAIQKKQLQLHVILVPLPTCHLLQDRPSSCCCASGLAGNVNRAKDVMYEGWALPSLWSICIGFFQYYTALISGQPKGVSFGVLAERDSSDVDKIFRQKLTFWPKEQFLQKG